MSYSDAVQILCGKDVKKAKADALGLLSRRQPDWQSYMELIVNTGRLSADDVASFIVAWTVTYPDATNTCLSQLGLLFAEVCPIPLYETCKAGEQYRTARHPVTPLGNDLGSGIIIGLFRIAKELPDLLERMFVRVCVDAITQKSPLMKLASEPAVFTDEIRGKLSTAISDYIGHSFDSHKRLEVLRDIVIESDKKFDEIRAQRELKLTDLGRFLIEQITYPVFNRINSRDRVHAVALHYKGV